MNRISLNFLVGIFLPCLLFFEVHAATKGWERKFDGRSLKSAEKCVELIKSELSETEFKVFFKAYSSIALRWVEEQGGNLEDASDWLGLMRRLDGMRVSEIIKMAETKEVLFPETLDRSKKNDEKSSETALEITSESNSKELHQPFVLDGVEMVVSDLRIGELKAKKMQSISLTLPADEYLIATVSLKNTTNGKIIVIHNAWQQVTLRDNFNNVYGQPIELPYFLEYVEGAIYSRELRAGEEAIDLLILPKPLDNAREFVLTADPGLYRNTEGGILEPMSESSFQIEFTRDDIQ